LKIRGINYEIKIRENNQNLRKLFIKQVSGHKTDYAFQHYILVTEDEMSGMKWLEQKEGKTGTMDTCEQSNKDNPCKQLKLCGPGWT
jgi:hypothetical protein